MGKRKNKGLSPVFRQRERRRKMRKSLNRLMALAAAAVFVAALPAIVSAATFSYYASSLFSQSGAMVSNGSGTDDPGPDSSWSHEYVESSQEAVTPDGAVNADGWGTGEVMLENQNLSVYVDGSVAGMSYDTLGHMESYGGASTVQAGVTTGIYFQLDPEAGENIGDPVRIDFYWMGDLGTSTGTTAHIDGGFAGDTIAITLNDYPAPSTFDPAKAVWTRPGNYAADGAGDDFWEDGGFFMAAIGDVVGIHMGAGADLNLDGEGYEIWAEGSQELHLTASPVPIPGAVWLLGSGLLGLVAVRRRKKNN